MHWIPIILIVTVMAGCATNPIGIEGIKSFYCGDGTSANPGAYKPVEWSTKDTDETIRQVKSNNSVYSDTCR